MPPGRDFFRHHREYLATVRALGGSRMVACTLSKPPMIAFKNMIFAASATVTRRSEAAEAEE